MEWDYDNVSWANATQEVEYAWNYTYIYISLPIITFCLLSVSVNLVILGSLFWVRRPISPTLHISLSLAVSDLVTIALDGLCLTLNSLLPIGFAIDLDQLSDCFRLFLEAVRLGSRFTTLGHLLGLAGNHYLGIRKPLQYPSLVTYKNITIMAFALWTLPPLTFLTYFTLLDNDGFSSPKCTANFMSTSDFRSVISYVFFGSILIMSAVYLHIYMLVLRHQAQRNRFRRAGSTYSRTHQYAEDSGARNEKALFTTLLIVGSTVLGWMPAALAFLLICNDCYLGRIGKSWALVVHSVTNILLIAKTALNTYIYAARMNEIRAAMKRMRLSFKRSCCKSGSPEANSFSESMQRRTSHRRSQRTVHCRVQSLQRRSSNTTPL